MRFDSGVQWYTHGTFTVDVSFPEGDVKCKWCPFLRSDNGCRHKCLLRERIVYSPETMADFCPLKLEEDNGTDT